MGGTELETLPRPGKLAFPSLCRPGIWWEHELRDGLHLFQWAACESKRHDTEDLGATPKFDCHTAMALHSESSPIHAGILRGVLSGSLRMREQLVVAKLADCASWLCHGHANESVEHCFRECLQWSQLRRDHDMLDAAVVAAWPASTHQYRCFWKMCKFNSCL